MTLKKCMGLMLAVIATVLVLPFGRADAACDALPQDKGQASYKVAIAVSGTYRLWMRMAAPAADRDSVFVQVDSQCPVTAGDGLSGEGWLWVNFQAGDSTKPITIDLELGEHTVTLAGREAGVGVDKVMFVGNATCTPVALGDNCLAATATTTETKTTPAHAEAVSNPASEWLGMPRALVLVLCSAVVLGALGFVVVKYVLFQRIMAAQAIQVSPAIVDGAPYMELSPPRKLVYFVRNHWIFIVPAGIAIVGGLAIAFAAASSAYPVFEAEAGTLSGNARVVEDASASGGKYALFEVKAGGATPSPGGTNKNTGSGGSAGGSTSGGGSSSGGSSGGLSGSCSGPTSHVPGSPDGMGGCWPGPNNTGPNASESSMATYSGSCTISAANTTIDSKVINCSPLSVNAGGLVVKNSYIKGGVINNGSASFTIQDSFIDNAVSYPACSGSTNCAAGKYACGDPNNATTDCGVGYTNFTILRTEIINTNRAAYCASTCTIQDSYFHGTNLWPDDSNLAHASSVRNEQYLTLRHNSLGCDYTGPFPNDEIGCSADMSGYPDFAPVMHATIDSNLFLSNNIGAGFCVYGGGTAGKPYSNNANNATYIVFTNNVFQRGANGKCGSYGPVTDFIVGRTGNVWTNNKYDNGATVDPE